MEILYSSSSEADTKAIKFMPFLGMKSKYFPIHLPFIYRNIKVASTSFLFLIFIPVALWIHFFSFLGFEWRWLVGIVAKIFCHDQVIAERQTWKNSKMFLEFDWNFNLLQFFRTCRPWHRLTTLRLSMKSVIRSVRMENHYGW